MIPAQHYAAQYQTMEVKTADPFELLIILYQSAVAKLQLAKQHFSGGHIEKRVVALNKAIAMIGELQAALDFERGQHIAVSLDQLYSYMLKRLTEANARQDTELIDEVISLLTTLQSAWEEARLKEMAQRPSLTVENQTSFAAAG